jgi:hypothetical protein
MPASEGCNPGKVWERRCVLKERRIRMDRTCGQQMPIGGVPSERVNVSGVVPKVAPWAGMRRPVGHARQVKGWWLAIADSTNEKTPDF